MSDDKDTEITPLVLPRFQKALRPYAADLPLETYRRYANGLLPKAVRFIVEHPELLEALVADARARSDNPTDVPT
jgi:hypothetical protein